MAITAEQWNGIMEYVGTNPITAFAATAGVLGATAFLINKYFKGNSKKQSTSQLSSHYSAPVPIQEEGEEEEDYPIRSIEDLVKKEGSATINGRITQHCQYAEGYCGIIKDATSQIPFYVSTDSSLLPIILDDAQKTQTPVELEVELENDEDDNEKPLNYQLSVNSLKYTLHGRKYVLE